MTGFFDTMLARLDRLTETGARRVAQTSGRRSFLAKAGTLILGGALAPMLPFDKSHATGTGGGVATGSDPLQCDYWRYCSLDGTLCTQCGGSLSMCPPGSEASTVSWVGTCRNPDDTRDYLISYNDCCGKTFCGNATFCNFNEGEKPGYRMALHNDINWCMANTSVGYHCTVAVLVGLAE
ncbi:methylamine dehydrogenase light chain [Mongoliimonas terrestris]|uniref:methylamine dehydrogenase light chain n=1 Tax=Mongoliimonas terrestris TaxID=1709001 RepID=UPI000ABB5C3C|nr:methylamine dehydrogenase light chain [Mongoliimonas terrestris]